MSDVKKVELGYSVPKERWKDAAENLREFGDLYAAKLIKENVDGLGELAEADKAGRTGATAVPKERWIRMLADSLREFGDLYSCKTD